MGERRIPTEELRTLTGRGKAAVSYQDKVYDVTEFLDKHPGGSQQLLLAAGRDVTHLFNSYHSFGTRKLIAKRCRLIGVLEETPQESNTETFTGKYPPEDKLYEELQKRIRKYFKDNNLNPHMEISFVLNGIAVTVAVLLFWYFAVSFARDGRLVASSIFSLLTGFSSSLCLMLVGHDVCHFAFTSKPWVWKWLSHIVCCVVGVSGHIWKYHHVIGHHIHPNHEKLDPDVTSEDSYIYRVLSIQSWCPHYIYQHIYVPLLYLVVSFKLKVMDFESMYSRKKGNIHINPPDVQEWVLFLLTKFAHIMFRLILPCFYAPFLSVLFLNCLAEAAGGFWLGFNLPLNHVNNAVMFPKSPSDMTWSEMQIATTADYATDSKFWSFLSGRLNHQIVHHLFPSVLSTYYSKITPIVYATCAEFGVPYICYSDIWSIWKSHLKYLKLMGQEDMKEK